MFVTVVAGGNLTEERLESIERGARERHTLMDRVVLELVEEVRRLNNPCSDGVLVAAPDTLNEEQLWICHHFVISRGSRP